MGLLSSDSTNDLYDGVDHIVEGVDVVVVEENLPDRLLVDSLLLSSSFAYRTDIEVSNQRRDEDPYSFPPCQALFQTANSRSSSLTNHQTEDYLEMGHFHDEGAPS